MSQASLAQASQAALGAVVQSAEMSSAAGRLVMQSFGLGAQYGVLLPYSRAHEAEADMIGLELMAMAGFDPHASVQLWRNMARNAGASGSPEWASTHPLPSSRIEALKAHMAGAEEAARAAERAGRVPACDAPPQ